MKIYIFRRLDQVSDNYHSEGALLVVAKDKRELKRLVEQEKYVTISDDEMRELESYELFKKYEPKVFVFPDAGCC